MLRTKFGREKKATQVDPLIDAVLEKMNDVGPIDPDYPKMLKYLEQLHRLRSSEKPQPVSRDTVWMIAGNLVGILIIVAYEKNNVMTSKGFTQLLRPQK